MLRGGDLEEHQPMDVQRGAGQSAGGVEGCKKLKRVAKDFSSVLGSKAVSIESCASSKGAELELPCGSHKWHGGASIRSKSKRLFERNFSSSSRRGRGVGETPMSAEPFAS